MSISDWRKGFLFSENARFIENYYNQCLDSRFQMDKQWYKYMEQSDSENTVLKPSWAPAENIYDNAAPSSTSENHTMSLKAMKLIDAFRLYGHLGVVLDPINLKTFSFPKELMYQSYGIEDSDLESVVYVGGAFSHKELKLKDLYKFLVNTYSGRFGVEFFHIDNLDEREWLLARLENDAGNISFTKPEKIKIFDTLLKVEMFEEYLHTKFPGAKRFSIEGGDSTIIAIEEIIKKSVKFKVQEAVLGMAHRGRLSVLTKVMNKPYHAVFAEFKGSVVFPEDLGVVGDVKYHLGASHDVEVDGGKVHLSLTHNPSHLEVVNSVVSGRVRAKQDNLNDKNREKVIGILLHGDAAFSGQGSVMESLSLSNIDSHKIGGVVHVITNNQIGFTTSSEYGRSYRYCTDVAKMINAPVFHVNGDDPEAVAYVSKIAAEYRAQFHKDVFIDIVCYRRYGHNEGDEPMFTQPLMYKKINNLSRVSHFYQSYLLSLSEISEKEIDSLREDFKNLLNQEFEKSDSYTPDRSNWMSGEWGGFSFVPIAEDKNINTSVNKKILEDLSSNFTEIPKDFNVHKKIEKIYKNRKDLVLQGGDLDWATGEALAYATLLNDGYNVRIVGQDVERGTFAHRHAVLVDQATEERYVPLSNMKNYQNGKFEIHNSILSEFAVMGFEYGYSFSSPNTLVIWEAQYGDFANGAQVIIDQYLSSGRDKWLRMNSLVLFLPHGYEGAGPEHSSARLERYLQLCANDNMVVANCTTPASLFHILRNHMLKRYRTPLILMTPKSLLRNKLAVSNIEEFSSKASFLPVIPDDLKASNVNKVVFCSGKVYYDLLLEREKRKRDDIALIRIEQLYPYPEKEIRSELSKYKVDKVIWCQEEHKNMGAWNYIKGKFYNILDSKDFQYVGRRESASVAAGYTKLHLVEMEEFLNKIFN